MTETTVRQVTVEANSTDQETELEHIGIEFEYPTGENAPIGEANESQELRDLIGHPEPWVLNANEREIPTGTMTSDHVGAEITSDILDLHTTQPEVWYYRTIQKAESLGFPFAAKGWGETIFGLHMHLSPLNEDKAHKLGMMCREPWSRAFFCTSVTATSADPWRHGGVSHASVNPDSTTSYTSLSPRSYGERDHYEFRLPEPMLPNHFGMVMHFLRLLDVEGFGAARDYAYEKVHSRDPMLTAVQQYRAHFVEGDCDLIEAMQDGRRTDDYAAEAFVEIMEGDA